MLDKIGKNVIYYDTDSVFYIDDWTVNIKTGYQLGEWTVDLGSGLNVTEWVSTGPKSLVYKMNNDKIVTKIKGFTLSYKNIQILNMDSLKKIVKNQIEKI